MHSTFHWLSWLEFHFFLLSGTGFLRYSFVTGSIFIEAVTKL
jgi:hypothetical protein